MGKDTDPYEGYPPGDVPQGDVPGELVIEVPVGRENPHDPKILQKIKELEAKEKKVITKKRAGEVVLIVLGGTLAAIAIEEGIRRHRKDTPNRRKPK
jgi:hypothetical protein